jgi:hypothetical protein
LAREPAGFDRLRKTRVVADMQKRRKKPSPARARVPSVASLTEIRRIRVAE